jgi:hypothetical protein
MDVSSRSVAGCSAANSIRGMGCGDVRDVDPRVLEAMAIEDFAAGASHERVWLLRGKLLANFPHGVFPRRPVPRIAPGPEIRLGAL